LVGALVVEGFEDLLAWENELVLNESP